MAMKMKFKKGDTVVVITGRDKGKTGEILKVFPETGHLIVQGVNVVKKHRKASQAGPGGIDQIELKIQSSNVSHVDPKTSKPTRVGYKNLDDGRKVRYAKASGEVID